jgi:hypothetical protein
MREECLLSPHATLPFKHANWGARSCRLSSPVFFVSSSHLYALRRFVLSALGLIDVDVAASLGGMDLEEDDLVRLRTKLATQKGGRDRLVMSA